MAEFKLGRIRFVWKDAWTTGTTYYVDDVVRFGGRTYICAVGHTSATDFNTDLEYNPTKWNQMSDGQDWKGDWATSTFYKLNDIVTYGGIVYLCTDSHTSAATTSLGLETDAGKWSVFAEGLAWKGNWSTLVRYKKNDLIRYGGYSYICNEGHTSSGSTTLGLEADQGKWDTFNDGFSYRGTWTTGVRYKQNDVVKYGAGLWVCVAYHTGSAAFSTDAANWEQLVEGFEFENSWDIATVYQPGDVVRYGGNQYVAKEIHSAQTPSTATTYWDLMGEGFSFQNDWVNTTSYKIGQVVRVNGLTYVATADSPSISLTVTASNATTKKFTTSSTAGLVAGMSITFSGTTFGGLMGGATYYVDTVPDLTTFTISTTQLGTIFTPTTASGSMSAKVAAYPTHPAYFSVLTNGMKWKGIWADDTEYNVGDVARYGSNAYICVLTHRSEADDGSTIGVQGGGAANSRPDRDTTGIYWNSLAIGNETEVLSVRGDMVYYGGAGPTRLPVGLEGQVLVSNGTDPEWRSLGKVDHVYYVASHGTDGTYPTHGATLDRPFKTIRYACQQVEKGCRNPNAAYLLEMNRVFIQREVTKYIDYKVANAVLGDIWYNFDYDEHKCERDVGFIVDRVIWDITHGGNLKMRAAAQTYLNALGEGPYSTEETGTGTYTKISTEGDNDVEAFGYMLTLVGNVLDNTAPTMNFQTEMGDTSTATVSQYINADYVAETGVLADITSLVGIVTEALTNGTSAVIPDRFVPSNTIYVKSGNYSETLPIIVPAETALVGDEVRSVHVAPRAGTTPLEDTFYTVSSMDRLVEVVDSIIRGAALTASEGNTEAQSAEWPMSTQTVADLATSKLRAMKYNIDFRTGTIASFAYPDPTDYNAGYLTGYGDARTLVLANKEFFKHQVKAWIDTNYPNMFYSRTSCLRDVGYITDALVYDLTYGGNAMSVQAGLAYYQGVGSSLYIDSTEKEATLAAYAYLKTMFQAAAANTTITALQTTETQVKDTSLTGGSAASTFIGNCITEMIDIVNNGTSAETLTDPSDAWADSTLTSEYAAMDAVVSTVQTDTIDYINTNFGNYTYNSALCRRDAGYMVDTAYYDAAFGSNFWAVQSGISYNRRQAGVVKNYQLDQEIGSVNYIKGVAATALASSATAVSRSDAAFNEIIAILGGTTESALTFTSTGTANYTNARAQLQTNRAFIISEMVTWMTANAPSYVALSAANKTLCQRDIGYAIDALSYDVNYGGNLATRNFARSLFNNITGESIQPLSEKTDSAASYTQLGAICAQIVRETYAGQDTSGTAASATEATRMTTLAGNIASVITAGNLTGLVAESAPSISWVAGGIQTAVGALATAKTDIVAGTLQYITDTYSSFSYNHAKCSRDVATIVKAIGYDMMFGSNFQTLKASYAYLRSTASEVFTLNQKTVTRAAIEFVRDAMLAELSDSTAIASVTDLFQAMDDVLYSGSAEGQVCASEDRTVDWAVLQLERNRAFIVQELHSWMNYNYVNFNDYYDSATCSRDVGIILDSVISDLATGSMMASTVAGMAYFRQQSALVTSAQMMQTVWAMKELKRIVATYVTDTGLYTTVNASFDNVLNILQNGLSVAPAHTWPDNGTSTVTTVADAGRIQTNRATIVSSMSTWMSTNYSTLWASLGAGGQAQCTRDVGYILDAMTYDLQYGGDLQSNVVGASYYSFGTLQLTHTGEKTAEIAAVNQIATLVKALSGFSLASQAVIDVLTTTITGIINTGTIPAYTLPSVAGESAAKIATHAAILAARTTIRTAITTYITNTFSSYEYNTALCNRDTNEIINALKWDLQYGSNYKTLLCSQWYANAVRGSLEENMFLLRNGTGVRNMTLEGLTGDLTPENAYGTRRVTAGAYASLDPGWGPDDFRTWIIHRSPYVQNCCTFGYGAIGQKIDGALHAGGYDSIVSNDFTQIISDGIGAWVTNNGRAELVSVFTYYSHIGYLAEHGGKIRGTNGNNSYGDFGSVAEGYDVTEIPGYGSIDNRNFVATVGAVNTDGAQEIFNFEFENAGSTYTEATWNITGAGGLADAEQDEFRDDAVFNVHLLDNVDDSTAAPEAAGNFGGFGYVSNANTAQGGTTTNITIAATDPEISTAYVGMKVYLTGGTGAGQYGIIATYNSGTKLATVNKESTGSAGWDHMIPGTTIVAPDASTTYVIEPAAAFTGPTFAVTAATIQSATWKDVVYGDTDAVYTGLSGSTLSAGTGATWQVIRNGSKYYVTSVATGANYERLDTITIPGTSVGGATTTNDITITITAISGTGAILGFDYDGYGVGGVYVAVSTNGTSYSTDGITWAASSMPSISGTWSAVTYGTLNDGSSVSRTSVFMAVSTGTSNKAAYSTDGITWNLTGNLPATANWVNVTFGEGHFVAIASNSTVVAMSYDGIVWDIQGTLNSTGWTSVTYGMGLFVAVKSGSTGACYSTNGLVWTDSTGGLPSSSAWSDVTWGNGRFVAISSTSGTVAAYSLNGSVWKSSTLPATASWTHIAYGQGVFLAVSTTTDAATSEDGILWTSRTMSTAANGFISACFGNPNRYGRFVAVGGSTGTVASYVRFGAKARARVYVSQEKIYAIRIVEPGSGYASAPTLTITDPNNTYDAPFTVRIGKGALANPSFKNRGTGYVSASADVDSGNGYGDYYQSGQYIAVKRMTKFPVPGSNVVFSHLPDETFKLVNVLTQIGDYPGEYSAFFQIAPPMKLFATPEHLADVTTRIRYSQVRLTGHDFLDVGSGNQDKTNYPGGIPDQTPTQASETVNNNGGRVFYTSTDQDGNFRVGELFTIEQSTGVATLNADAFNIAGLQELTLGEVSLGGGSASISEFSTDPFFTANSDTIVPTQRAIKAYIASQIGGGGASLNVNSVTAGYIYIAGQQITTTTGGVIQMRANFEFRAGVTGLPVAWNFFLN